MDARAWANRAATAAGDRRAEGALAGLAFAAKDSFDVSCRSQTCLLQGKAAHLRRSCKS